jgi:ribosome biogenesis ATPase
LGVPNEEARIEILKILTRKMRLNPEIDMKEIVKMTPGYVGADISTLCKEASIQAVSRIIHEQCKEEEDAKMEEDGDLENIFIELNDFKIASKRVQPSAQREGFSTVPNTTWKDVGALDAVRAELHLSIV